LLFLEALPKKELSVSLILAKLLSKFLKVFVVRGII